MGVTGGTRMSPFVTEMSFRTGVSALSSAGTWFTIGVGRLLLLLLILQWSKVNTISSYRAGRCFNFIRPRC